MVQKLLCKTHKKTFNIKNDPLHSPQLYKKKPQHIPSFQFLLPVLKPRFSLNGLARFSSMCPTQPTNHRNRCMIYTHLHEANNVTILGPLSLIPHLFPQAHWGRTSPPSRLGESFVPLKFHLQCFRRTFTRNVAIV